ncbi:hypothetical protein [Brevundimonas balnearis]|uniref:Outer membrane protein beta-barrel domain-containing protein n=1 Tax=Brevundimonas balnearis TaxID=1572858 RepID=A0ABV6QZ55_9CAUL
MSKTIAVASALALVAAAGAAQAQTAPGQWTFGFEAGAEFPTDGEVHEGAIAPVPDLGPLNPALAGVDAELRIEPRSYDDIYGEAFNLGFEAAYGVSDSAEAFGSVRYVKSDEGTVQVGGAFVPALNTTLPVFGTFGDVESWIVEAGYRQYFGSGAIRPYVAGRLGAAFTDSVEATFEIPDADILIANAPFYDSTTSISAGIDLGVSWQVSDTVSLQAETGYRYVGELDGDDSAIGGLGLASINDVGERTYVPLTVRAKFTF